MQLDTTKFPPSLQRAFDDGVLPKDAVLAIDGPAGSGKSTTAKALAERFGLLYIDTGAMYRALTQHALAHGIAPTDEEQLAAIAGEADLELVSGKGEVTVLWNGTNVSQAIRTPEVDAAVSGISSIAGVRANMVRRQQEMGRKGGVVMEGRDIGTVVFPLATAKIFLSADLEARVERRFKQYQQRGQEVSREELTRDLAERDRQDSERETAPLCISPDSMVIDCSTMNLAEQNEACARAALLNPTLDLDLDTDRETAIRNHPFGYRMAYTLYKTLDKFYGLKQIGNEGGALPKGCIIAVNHISNWDPPLVGGTFYRYPVHTLAKAELFKIFPLNFILRWIDGIPINRRGYDKKAFGTARRILNNGANLLIFPEGTRQAIGHPGSVKNGLGILVQATEAPMVPVFIRGSYGKMPMGSTLSPLEVQYGPVIRWHGIAHLNKTMGKKEMSKKIAQVCESAYRELQARTFARYPQTDFEKELGKKQLKAFARRHKKVFKR
jgi:CMP/dCMP kinase